MPQKWLKITEHVEYNLFSPTIEGVQLSGKVVALVYTSSPSYYRDD